MSGAAKSKTLITRDETRQGRIELSPPGCALVEKMAERGNPQALIASALGISLTAFKALLKRDELAEIAYETGRAKAEFVYWNRLRAEAANPTSKMGVVSAIAALKLGWGYRDSGAPTVEVKVSGGVMVVPPDEPSGEAWYARYSKCEVPS